MATTTTTTTTCDAAGCSQSTTNPTDAGWIFVTSASLGTKTACTAAHAKTLCV